jgi:folylpolyglutamate synthase/dihydropteroate synthase
MDQNTYKKDARSNFVTGFAPKQADHTDGYQIESVAIEEAGVSKEVKYVITDTRMQIRLPKAVPAKGSIRLKD